MPWSTGEAAVERLLAAGHVERVPGSQADGASWLGRARRGTSGGSGDRGDRTGSSVALVYDAAGRPASLLAQQGLRPTTAGGHYAVEEVIRAQFGPALRASGLAPPTQRTGIPGLSH